jgi:hypothetical protein
MIIVQGSSGLTRNRTGKTKQLLYALGFLNNDERAI